MYGRTQSDGEAELEALLGRFDSPAERALPHASPGGPPAAPEAEALSQALDGEAMDLDAVREAWRAIPQDVKQSLFAHARQAWNARGTLLDYLIAMAYSLMRGGMPPGPAMRAAALQLRIQPRRDVQPAGMSHAQVAQYHARQQRRGRRPGQNPQTRPRLQREAETFDGRGNESRCAPRRASAEAELEQLMRGVDAALARSLDGEAMAKPATPPPKKGQAAKGQAPKAKAAKAQAPQAAPAKSQSPQTTPPTINIGEIKPDSPSGQKAGQRALNKLNNWQGNEGLVLYDQNGNLRYQVRDAATTQVVFDQKIGQLPPGAIPPGAQFGSPQFGNIVEPLIINQLEQLTGQKFKHKHPSATGPDLVPV